MKKAITLLAFTVLVATTAQGRPDQRREMRQQGRIAQGVQSGELTKQEARKLHRGQKRVDQAQKEARADGTVSQEERQDIRKMQRRQSGAIYHQKHDGQERK